MEICHLVSDLQPVRKSLKVQYHLMAPKVKSVSAACSCGHVWLHQDGNSQR